MTTPSAASVWIRLAKCYGVTLRSVRQIPMRGGLTLPQFDVLAQLLRHPDGMTSKELSRELLVTAGNVTGLITRLQAHGLVERNAHPLDRRAVLLELSPSGRRLIRAEMKSHEQELDKIFKRVTAKERARLNASLDLFRSALES